MYVCTKLMFQMQHTLELGDEIRLDSHAPYLKIFDPILPSHSHTGVPTHPVAAPSPVTSVIDA